jgi:hypothetical protein
MDDTARDGVIRVGEGRGFVIDARCRGELVVVTCAHCLPDLPPSMAMLDERTYAALLGSIDGANRIAAECLFVDPVANIAVLGHPDNRAYPTQSASFGTFLAGRTPFRVTPVSDGLEAAVLLLSLDGEWLPALVNSVGQSLFLSDCEVSSAMAGSPILINGAAVGAVGHTSDMPVSRLVDSLPGWLLRQLGQ